MHPDRQPTTLYITGMALCCRHNHWASMAPLTFARLRKWNLGVGIVQLITGATILAITPYSSQTKLPFFTFFIASWSRDDGPVSNFYK